MPDTTSTVELSDLVKASPSLMRLYEGGWIPLPELERQARGAARLREGFSSNPFHANRAKERGPDYWVDFYGSLMTLYEKPDSTISYTTGDPAIREIDEKTPF